VRISAEPCSYTVAGSSVIHVCGCDVEIEGGLKYQSLDLMTDCISPTVFNENKFKNVAEFIKYTKKELI
jgi:hypothetical protein